jgi:hypothetical protein|tara:strand:+ start:178 stop:444 length:267 start_codon:yes stop_codon:yes gene_type:complete
MGSLFKTPKYTPPPEMKRNEELLNERDRRAEASEKKEIRKLAARSRTRRKGGRLLYSQDRDLPALGVGTTLTDVASVRDPMKDERMMT